jgi:hypothetical protein
MELNESMTPHGEALYFLPNAIKRNKEQEELRSFSKYFSRKPLQPFLDIRSSRGTAIHRLECHFVDCKKGQRFIVARHFDRSRFSENLNLKAFCRLQVEGDALSIDEHGTRIDELLSGAVIF